MDTFLVYHAGIFACIYIILFLPTFRNPPNKFVGDDMRGFRYYL